MSSSLCYASFKMFLLLLEFITKQAAALLSKCAQKPGAVCPL